MNVETIETFRFSGSFGVLAVTPVLAQEQQESIVLSVSPKMVRWADVYKVRPERADDPYYHVRVIERQKGWKVWQFNELAFHMAVTRKRCRRAASTRR